MSVLFIKAMSSLMKSEFVPDQKSTKIHTGAYSRAGTIIREAGKGGYETIILGRRGFLKVDDFFIGRVSNKLIRPARKEAVWLVS